MAYNPHGIPYDQGVASPNGVSQTVSQVTAMAHQSAISANESIMALSGGIQSFSGDVDSLMNITRGIPSGISAQFQPMQVGSGPMGMMSSIGGSLGLTRGSGFTNREFQSMARAELSNRMSSAALNTGEFLSSTAFSLLGGVVGGLVGGPVGMVAGAIGGAAAFESVNPFSVAKDRNDVESVLAPNLFRSLRRNPTSNEISGLSKSFIRGAMGRDSIGTGDIAGIASIADSAGIFDTSKNTGDIERKFKGFLDKVEKLAESLDVTATEAANRIASRNPSLMNPAAFSGMASAAGLTTGEINRAGQQAAAAFRGSGIDSSSAYGFGASTLADIRSIQTSSEMNSDFIRRYGGLQNVTNQAMGATKNFMGSDLFTQLSAGMVGPDGRIDSGRLEAFSNGQMGLGEVMANARGVISDPSRRGRFLSESSKADPRQAQIMLGGFLRNMAANTPDIISPTADISTPEGQQQIADMSASLRHGLVRSNNPMLSSLSLPQIQTAITQSMMRNKLDFERSMAQTDALGRQQTISAEGRDTFGAALGRSFSGVSDTVTEIGSGALSGVSNFFGSEVDEALIFTGLRSESQILGDSMGEFGPSSVSGGKGIFQNFNLSGRVVDPFGGNAKERVIRRRMRARRGIGQKTYDSINESAVLSPLYNIIAFGRTNMKFGAAEEDDSASGDAASKFSDVENRIFTEGASSVLEGDKGLVSRFNRRVGVLADRGEAFDNLVDQMGLESGVSDKVGGALGLAVSLIDRERNPARRAALRKALGSSKNLGDGELEDFFVSRNTIADPVTQGFVDRELGTLRGKTDYGLSEKSIKFAYENVSQLTTMRDRTERREFIENNSDLSSSERRNILSLTERGDSDLLKDLGQLAGGQFFSKIDAFIKKDFTGDDRVAARLGIGGLISGAGDDSIKKSLAGIQEIFKSGSSSQELARKVQSGQIDDDELLDYIRNLKSGGLKGKSLSAANSIEEFLVLAQKGLKGVRGGAKSTPGTGQPIVSQETLNTNIVEFAKVISVATSEIASAIKN